MVVNCYVLLHLRHLFLFRFELKIFSTQYRIISFKLDNLEFVIRKRRLNFYGRMVGMDQEMLNKQLFEKNMEYKGLTQIVKQIKENLGTSGIQDDDYKVNFRKKIDNIWTLGNGNNNKVPKMKWKWDEKRRQEQGERTKVYWANRKKKPIMKPSNDELFPSGLKLYNKI